MSEEAPFVSPQSRGMPEAERALSSLVNPVFQQAIDAILIADDTGRYVAANAAAANLLGYAAPEDVVGLTVLDVTPPEARDGALEMWSEFMRRERLEGRYRVMRSDAALVEVDYRAVANIVPGLHMAMLRDMTVQRHAENELREQRVFMQSILDSIQDGITVLNPDLTIRYANPVIETWYGGRGPAAGHKCHQCYMGRIEPCDRCPALRTLRSGAPDREIMAGVSGSAVEWVEVFTFPISDPETGDVTGIVEFMRDITDRMRTEERLRVADLVVRNSPAILFRWLPEEGWPVEYVSDNISRFGYSSEEMMSGEVTYSEIVHPEDLGRVGEEVRGMVAQGASSYTQEYRLIDRDGKLHWVHDRTSVERDRSGKVVRFEGIVLEITERRRQEEMRLAMERHLLHNRKMESLGVLAGGVAHDFNNLLMAILGNVEMLLEDTGPGSEVRDMLEEIQVAGKKAASLSLQMLTYAGRGALAWNHIDPAAMLEEMHDLVRGAVPDSVAIEWRVEDDLPAARGDFAQLRQALMNLVSNAAEALNGHPGGRIAILASRLSLSAEELRYVEGHEELAAGEFVEIAVEDNGPGFDESHRGRLFDPFFTTRFVGRGLGLSAVLGVMRAHRGGVAVRNLPQGGARFAMLLPAEEPEGAS